MTTQVVLEQVKPEVDAYIAQLFSEFRAKTTLDITPFWFWGPGWPPAYYPGLNSILIPDIVAVFWRLDKEKTKVALKWGLGHEYIHFIQDHRTFPITTFPWIAEQLASMNAFRISGITNEDGFKAWKELFEMY